MCDMFPGVVMSLPKMHWLPKDEWVAPRVGVGSEELSGEAPLAGLFSGDALDLYPLDVGRAYAIFHSRFTLPPIT